MSDINAIHMTGRLGQTPEIKYFDSGSVNVKFSIGVNKWIKKQEQEVVTWFNCIAWGKKAEFIGEYIKKGDLVYIEGSLSKETWKDEQGNTKSNTYILVDEIKTQSKKQ